MESHKQSTSVPDLNLFISAATDLSKRKTNQDAYGYSDGCEVILSEGKERAWHSAQYEKISEFMAVIADGVSGADHTDKTEDDAAALITEKILEDLFDEFSLTASMPLIADEINDTMNHASAVSGKQLAAALSIIGIYPEQIKILSMGDTTVMRFRSGKAELITPLPVTSMLREFAGNPAVPGRNMADIYQMKPEIDDIYVLATDGIIHGFTDSKGFIRTNDIYRLLIQTQYNADALIKEAKKTSGDNLTACVIHLSKAADQDE